MVHLFTLNTSAQRCSFGFGFGFGMLRSNVAYWIHTNNSRLAVLYDQTINCEVLVAALRTRLYRSHLAQSVP